MIKGVTRRYSCSSVEGVGLLGGPEVLKKLSLCYGVTSYNSTEETLHYHSVPTIFYRGRTVTFAKIAGYSCVDERESREII